MVPMLWIALVVLGITALLRGLAGRVVHTRPTCTGCGTEVGGIVNDDEPNCPKCRAFLERPGAVTCERRERMKGTARVGAATLVGAALVGGGLLARPTLLDLWQQNRPTGMVIDDLRADDPAARRAAVAELEQRYDAGAMTAADLDALMGAITAQAWLSEPALVFMDHDGLYRRLRADGHLDGAALRGLADAVYSSGVRCTVEQRARRGDALDFELRHGDDDILPGLRRVVALRRVGLDGADLPATRGHDAAGAVSGAGAEPFTGRVVLDADPGPHELTLEVAVGLVDERLAAGLAADGPGPESAWPATTLRWVERLRIAVEVLPDDPAGPITVTDAETERALRAAIRVASLRVEPGAEGEELRLTLDVDRALPVAISFDVYAVVDETERRLGGVSQSASSVVASALRCPADGWSDRETITLELRPSAENEPNADDAPPRWGRTLVLPDVPVARATVTADAEEEAKKKEPKVVHIPE